ncbi:glycoside hydrolase family 3 domain [Lecanosticta acicola]|uniref:beta-glucosidase n=1 Tax=Lecanosticta acicola TaxID=111012 RepID=A0AAI8YY20_9PEZI|nr:glycoside hydrolase family 3 domain [Lecanosticta acicola]
MTAYPKINGEHADPSRLLVHDILRREWCYNGFVMSDWGGLNDIVPSILATTALEMPRPPLWYGKALLKAGKAEHVFETEHIDPGVRRLLVLLRKTRALISEREN